MKLSPRNAPRMEYRSTDAQPTVAELREKKAQAIARMKEIDAKSTSEGRTTLTSEETTEFDRLRSEVRAADQAINRREEIDKHERSIAPAITRNGGKDGTYEQRARECKLCNVIAAQLPNSNIDAGLELEISQEVAKRNGKNPEGIYAADELFQERRAILTSADGSSLYPTQHRDDMYIDILRENLLIARLGATVVTGLNGDQEIPRLTDSIAAHWIGEHEDSSESNPKFDKVNLKPKTISALVDYSRRMFLNSAPGIEKLVRNDMASVLGTGTDKAALIGDGVGNKPTGVFNQEGVTRTPINSGSLLDDLLEFYTLLTTDNALNGNVSWLTSPRVYKMLRTAQRSAETPLINTPGVLLDHSIQQSNHIPSTGPANETPIVLGNWSDLLVGYWSGVDILVDPFTLSSKGGVRITAMQDVDVAVRHPESFVISGGWTE